MFLIKNGRVHTGKGQILQATDILVEGDRIREIGKDLKVAEAKVFDASGKEVYPGFIDPVTVIGCHDGRMYDNNEMTNPINPDLQTCYAFDSDHFLLQSYYDVGLTRMAVGAWNTNVLGGRMSIYKTFGTGPEDMLYRKSCIMKGSLTELVKKTYGPKNKLPMTKMGMVALLERALHDAENYQPEKGERDFKKEAMKKVIDGEIPFFVACNKASEILSLLSVLEGKDKVRLTITSAYQAPQCKQAIYKAMPNVVLGDQEVMGDWNEDLDYESFKEMLHKGVNLSMSVTSDGRFSGKEAYLWTVANMYKAGFTEEEIIQMMTFNPAKTLEIEDELGSLEAGKLADLVVYEGNLVKSYRANAVLTLISGEVVYERK